MAGYVLKRIGYSLLTILVLVALTFFMMQLLPGDPFIGAKAIDESTKAMLMVKYGLDKPVWQQFIMYVGNVFQGDLGFPHNISARWWISSPSRSPIRSN